MVHSPRPVLSQMRHHARIRQIIEDPKVPLSTNVRRISEGPKKIPELATLFREAKSNRFNGHGNWLTYLWKEKVVPLETIVRRSAMLPDEILAETIKRTIMDNKHMPISAKAWAGNTNTSFWGRSLHSLYQKAARTEFGKQRSWVSYLSHIGLPPEVILRDPRVIPSAELIHHTIEKVIESEGISLEAKDWQKGKQQIYSRSLNSVYQLVLRAKFFGFDGWYDYLISHHNVPLGRIFGKFKKDFSGIPDEACHSLVRESVELFKERNILLQSKVFSDNPHKLSVAGVSLPKIYDFAVRRKFFGFDSFEGYLRGKIGVETAQIEKSHAIVESETIHRRIRKTLVRGEKDGRASALRSARIRTVNHLPYFGFGNRTLYFSALAAADPRELITPQIVSERKKLSLNQIGKNLDPWVRKKLTAKHTALHRRLAKFNYSKPPTKSPEYREFEQIMNALKKLENILGI